MLRGLEEPILSLKNVSMNFLETLAVKNVDFNIYKGKVHAIVGENGAGKSTLMNIIGGLFNDFSGEIFLDGQAVSFTTPSISKDNGIEMIHQELSLAGPISIAENLLTGRLPCSYGIFLNKKKMIEETKKNLKRVGLGYLDPMMRISDISQHEAQLIELAKALANNPRILIMDEPTSSLSHEETERLFNIIKDLKKQGLAIVYVSHHLEEVFKIADLISVMRDGRKVGTFIKGETNIEKIVELMVGQKKSEFYKYEKNEVKSREELLRVKNASRYGFFHNISFYAKAGEIIGICGLTGSGRSEMARSICGVDPLDSGEIFIHGKKVLIKNLTQAIKHKLIYLTEDRKNEGLALRLTLGENLLVLLMPKFTEGILYREQKGEKVCKKFINKLLITPQDPKKCISNFSGGNQQKALIAKYLTINAKILFLDEPTKGVDVGAKEIIHQVIREHVNNGNTVIFISSDLTELLSLSDRIYVMRYGHFIEEIQAKNCNEETLLLSANGGGGIR